MDLCFANMLNYGISLFSVFSLKTLLEESSRVRARQVRQTVEFTGKLLRIRRSLEQHDSLRWPLKETSLGFNFDSEDTSNVWKPGRTLMEYIKNVRGGK